MKKQHHSTSLRKILCVFGGSLILLAALSSCDNFLNNGTVAQDIKNKIDYNNAPSYTILLKADNKQGSFLSANEKTIKIGYSVEVEFSANIEGYKFLNLEAVSKADPSVSRADSVQFTDLDRDEKRGLYKIKITLLKAQNDIQIQPVCLEYPKVVSYSPTGTQLNPANTPIEINFNIPMEASIIQKIKLTQADSEISQYFETPILSADKTKLTIIPNASDLMTYIGNAGSIKVNVSISSSITVTKDKTILPIIQDENLSFDVNYKPVTDFADPRYVPDSFFVTRETITAETDISTLKKFNNDIFLLDGELQASDPFDYFTDPDLQQAYSQFLEQEEKILQNEMGKSVYLYGKFTDTDSGIGKITISEEFKGIYYTECQNNTPVTTDYYVNSPDVILFDTDSKGVTTFCINHQLKSEDGAVAIKLIASDICNNTVESPVIYGFKRTETIFDNPEYFKLYNSVVDTSNETYSEELQAEKLKTLTLSALSTDDPVMGWYYGEDLYGFSLPASMNTITCTYKNKEDEIETYTFERVDEDNENYWVWQHVLDVNQVNGLELLIEIKDTMGNIITKNYTIPSVQDFAYILTTNPYEIDPSYTEVHARYYYVSGEEIGDTCFQEIDSSDTITICHNEDELYFNYSYIPIPCYTAEKYQETPTVYFYTESPEGVKFTYMDGSNSGSTFELENFPDTGKPYKLETASTTNNRTTVSIIIPDSIWTTNKCENCCLFIKEKGLLPKVNAQDPEIGNKMITIEKGTHEVSFELRTEDLFASDTEIILYGIVNNKPEYEKSITIEKIAKASKEYDNNLPTFEFVYTDPETVKVTIIDKESGPKEAYFFEGADVYTEYGNNFDQAYMMYGGVFGNVIRVSSSTASYPYTLNIPAWFFNADGFSYYIFDQQGNIYCNKMKNLKDYYFPSLGGQDNELRWWIKKIRKESSSSNDLRLTFQREYTSADLYFIYIYEFDKTNQKWGTPTKIALNSYEENGTTYYEPLEFHYFILPTTSYTTKDCFVKIITAGGYPDYIETANGWCEDITNIELLDFSRPYYANLKCASFNYFTDDDAAAAAYDSSYDLLLANGTSTESVAIYSHSPVLVQTIVSRQPYDDCKTWDANKWLLNTHILDEKQIDFDDSSSTIKKYSIPMNKIDEGQCYVVVAHFVDGHMEKSEVMVK